MDVASQTARAARLAAALERDGPTCVWCARPFGDLVLPTTEHLVPRVKGGPSWPENEVAACRRCNGERGHQSVTAFAEECVRRGWQPDLARMLRCLADLDAAIALRGGQRRARPFIERERRRLARWVASGDGVAGG